jgi:hypothetical protein
MEDVAVAPGLSQPARVVDTFVAPSKTFADIPRNASWWLPFLLILVFGSLYGTLALKKVGVPTMADNMLHTMPKLEQMMTDNPAAAPKIREKIEGNMRSQFYTAPIVIIVAGFAVAGLFLMSATFIFGGTGSYKSMLAVFWYSLLPLIIMNVLVCVMLLAGINVDTFLVSNPAATNIGYFLQGGDHSPLVVALAGMVDIFSLWIFLLQSLGVAIVSRISFGKACVAVGIWWVLYCGVKLLPILLYS